MEPVSKNFRTLAGRALDDGTLQQALGGLRQGLIAQRTEAVDARPDFELLRDRARDVRDHALANLDHYLELYERNAVAAGGAVHWASTPERACEIILAICKDANANLVAKGKSMISEEIGLNAHLIDAGLKVVETDLGEYLLQLRGETPSHIIAPAIHLTPDQVARDFRRHHSALEPQRDLESPVAMVGEAREVLRETFAKVDVGITGANFLIAETGSSVIVTNEGNGDLSQTLAKVHIVIASIDKVVATMDDMGALLKVLARSATGQTATTYTTISTGPRRGGDCDGPEAYHVVLLDNGRSDLLKSALGDVLRCIRCGACMNHCPVYQAIGGHAYGWVYPGPIGAVLTPALSGLANGHHLPNASTFCSRCEDVCPVRIPLTKLMRAHREAAFEGKCDSNSFRLAMKVWGWIALRPKLYRIASGAMVAVLGFLGRAKGRFRWLPLAESWTRHRDFPAPNGRTFVGMWTKRGGLRHDE